MKVFGIILIGVSVGIVASLVIFVAMGGTFGSRDTPSDEEFLDLARVEASQDVGSGNESALLPADVGGDYKLPKIEVDTEAFDMGLIGNNKVAAAEMTVYNRGNAPLFISRVTTSCGCTLGKMRDGIIPPGGSGTLEITVNPSRIPGFSSRKILTLYSNDPGNPHQKVSVAALVEREYELEPTVMEFGVVAKGATPEATVTLRQAHIDTFEVLDGKIKQNAGIFDFSIEEKPESEWEEPGHREYLVTGRILPDAGIGTFPSNIELATNIKRLRGVKIPMHVKIEGLYRLEPPVVTMREATQGKQYKDVLKVVGSVPIEVVSIEGTNSRYSVNQRPSEEPNTVAIDITMDDTEGSRLLSDKWELTIRAGDQEFKETVNVVAIFEGEILNQSAAINTKVGAGTISAAVKKTLGIKDVSLDINERVQYLKKQRTDSLVPPRKAVIRNPSSAATPPSQ